MQLYKFASVCWCQPTDNSTTSAVTHANTQLTIYTRIDTNVSKRPKLNEPNQLYPKTNDQPNLLFFSRVSFPRPIAFSEHREFPTCYDFYTYSTSCGEYETLAWNKANTQRSALACGLFWTSIMIARPPSAVAIHTHENRESKQAGRLQLMHLSLGFWRKREWLCGGTRCTLGMWLCVCIKRKWVRVRETTAQPHTHTHSHTTFFW